MPIFYRFDSENDVVSNFKTTVSSGIFSGGVGSLTSFFTSSVQSGSTGAYYYDVYKTDPLLIQKFQRFNSLCFMDTKKEVVR